MKEGEKSFSRTSIDLSMDKIKPKYIRCCVGRMYGDSIACKVVSLRRNAYMKL